jgi:FkbM family methyltransferase
MVPAAIGSSGSAQIRKATSGVGVLPIRHKARMSDRVLHILHRIQRKSSVAWSITRVYRDWPMVALEIFRLLRPRPIVHRLRNGLELCVRTGTYDLSIINEIWIDQVYTSSPGFAIRNDWVIADIGGHKGIFSVFAASRARGVKVFAFEASPETFAQLSHNIQRNKLSNVTAFNVAVCGEDGESTLRLYPDNGQNTLLHRTDHALQPTAGIKVETWSMARVLKTIASPVNLLKMDIEGMEYEALLSCTAEDLKAVERIALEYHDDCVSTSHRVSVLVDFLNANGFSTRLCPGRAILIAERPSGNC